MTGEILAVTEHLVLRRMTNDDAAALAAYRSDPVQARYQSWETPYPVDSARALIVEMRNVRFAQPGVWLQIGIETGGAAHRRHRGPRRLRHPQPGDRVDGRGDPGVRGGGELGQGLQIGQVGVVPLAVGGESARRRSR